MNDTTVRFKRDRYCSKLIWRKFALHYRVRKLVVITNARRRVISHLRGD